MRVRTAVSGPGSFSRRAARSARARSRSASASGTLCSPLSPIGSSPYSRIGNTRVMAARGQSVPAVAAGLPVISRS